MSQHDNNNADRPICNDSSRGSSHWLSSDAEEGIVGRAVAVNAPGAAYCHEEGKKTIK